MAITINLSGIVILVTGASGGIGFEIAKHLIQSGATLAIHYNNNKEGALQLLSGENNGSEIFYADLSSSEQTIAMFNKVMSHFGKLDCLVNNAGVFIKSELTSDLNKWISDWEFTQNVNLKSAAILSKMAIEHFIVQGGGRIIHIASRAAYRGDLADYLAYAASKGGMIALHKSIARSFGKDNIKSFAIAPGFVKTPMAEPFINEVGEDFVLNEIALNQLTTTNDIAPTVVFLASGYMDHATGATIDINAASYVR